jgi:hypothetical protein
MLQVINQLSDLKGIQSKLENAYESHLPISFYTPKYILSVYEIFLINDDKSHLFFVIDKKGDEITHYIPLYIDSRKTLRFIFDKHTDYCSSIGREMDFSTLKELSRLIIEHPGIQRMELDNLLPNDQLLNSFKHFFGLGSVVTSYNNHSFISSSTDRNFFAHLKSKEKSEMKRVQKKNEGYTFKILNDKAPFPKEELMLLREEMIANKSRNVGFFDDSFFLLIETLYGAGELEIFSKWDKDKLVSSSLVLKNDRNNYRMVWIDLYADVQFINLSAYVDYIHYLQQFPEILFSFGRGSYDYKSKNFQPDIQNLYNFRYSKSKFNFFFSHYYSIKLFAKRLIRDRK